MTLIYIRDNDSAKDKKFIYESLADRGNNSIYAIEAGDPGLGPISEDEEMVFIFLHGMSIEMEQYLSGNALSGLAETN